MHVNDKASRRKTRTNQSWAQMSISDEETIGVRTYPLHLLFAAVGIQDRYRHPEQAAVLQQNVTEEIKGEPTSIGIRSIEVSSQEDK